MNTERRNLIPWMWMLLLWGMFIVYGTTLPFELNPEERKIALGLENLSTPDLVSNVLLFIPWGVFFVLAVERRGFLLAMAGAVLSSTLLSVGVEILQLFFSNRVSAVSDVLCNTAGGAVGAGLGWFTARRLLPTWRPRLSAWLRRWPLTVLAVLIAILFLLEAASPFDVSLDVDDLKSASKGMRALPLGPSMSGAPYALEPFKLLARALAWMLAGAAFLLAFRERGASRGFAVLGAGLVAGLVAGLRELGQLAIVSRGTDATEIPLAWASACLGAWLLSTPWATRSRRSVVELGLLLWWSTQMLSSWSPWHFRAPVASEWPIHRFLPFIHYFFETDVYALADALNQTLYYLPLGVLLCLLRPQISLRAVALVALTVSLVLELGQIFVDSRVSDLTDVMLSVAGAVVGAALWNRALERHHHT